MDSVSLGRLVTATQLCGFVFLFEEMLFQVIFSVVFIHVGRKLIMLPATTAYFSLHIRKMDRISGSEI